MKTRQEVQNELIENIQKAMRDLNQIEGLSVTSIDLKIIDVTNVGSESKVTVLDSIDITYG